jgi:hypothetical protein
MAFLGASNYDYKPIDLSQREPDRREVSIVEWLEPADKKTRFLQPALCHKR